MKKALLATAIIGLVSTTAGAATLFNDGGSTLDFYGRMVGQANSGDSVEDASYVRLGLKGKSQITDSLYGFGAYELQYGSDNGEYDLDTRLGYAGIGGVFGELSYGRQHGAYNLVSGMTDVLFEFGGSASGAGTDRFGTGRASGVLKYAQQLGDLTIHASTQFDNSQVDHEDTRRSYGAAATYALPMGVTLGAAHNVGRGAEGTDDAKVTAYSAAWEFNSLYLAGLYSTGQNWKAKSGTETDTDYTGYELVATYKLTNELTLASGYNRLKKEEANLAAVDDAKYYTAGVQYRFNSNFRMMGEYQLDRSDKKDNVLAMAMRYEF